MSEKKPKNKNQKLKKIKNEEEKEKEEKRRKERTSNNHFLVVAQAKAMRRIQLPNPIANFPKAAPIIQKNKSAKIHL